MKYFYLVLVLLSFNSFAQKDKKKAFNDENFKLDSLPNVILRELNRFRTEKGLDRLEFSDMLNEAAYASADDMAGTGKDKVELNDTKRNLKKAGATKRGEEVTMKAPISKGRESYKTADVAKVIDRHAANVHAHMTGHQRRKRLDLP